jgi:uroporphyrinogen decarboxylase
MDGRERVTRAIERRGPDRVPARVGPSSLMWKTHRERLQAVVDRLAFPSDMGFGPAPAGREVGFDYLPGVEREGDDFVDAWGVVWHNAQEGIVGIPKVHPLADWKDLARLKVPDTSVDEWGDPIDWDGLARQIASSDHRLYVRADGERLWERMWFLRGMEALMMDVAEEAPQVQDLVDLVVDHNARKVARWLELDIDGVIFGDDWGAQDRLLINPRHWRKYFKPAYARLFDQVKRAGKHVWLHSNGHILPIIPDLIEIGLDVINPQVNCNGLAEIARLCEGRLAVDSDLDRQRVIPFGSPDEVRAHVRETIQALAEPEGGLLIIAYAYPLAPLENVEALYQAFREYTPYPIPRGQD